MSLSTLNSPPLLGTLGVASLYALPKIHTMAKSGAISFAVLKGTNLAMYTLQTICVSIPGRLDGEVSKAMSNSSDTTTDTSTETSSLVGNELTPKGGRTLVAPAGWAFAIWGPIFLGEAVFAISQLFVSETSAVAPILRDVSIPFSFAHLFQTLWCVTFRPKYIPGNLMYISAGMLGATAFSLSKAHAAYTTAVATAASYSTREYLMYFLPMSLHFGWTTAAALVNLNGAVSMSHDGANSQRAVAVVGHLSAVLASALGVYVSLDRSAPVFAGVISWALFAVADGMRQRVKALGNEEKNKTTRQYLDARNQKILSSVGAWISAGASVWSAVRLFRGPSQRNMYDATP